MFAMTRVKGKCRIHKPPKPIGALKCLWKHRYESERVAKSRAEMGGVNGIALYTYKCQHCKGFHLTSRHPSRQYSKKAFA